MRPALFALIALGACSIGPAPAITPPQTQRCSDLRHGLVGTWVHDAVTLELRTDGSLLRNGADGTWRFGSPGRVTIDVGGSHELHALGLMSGATLLDVPVNGDAVIWTRVSIVPAFPDGCFEIRGSLVGDWSDGVTSESFLADGTFVRGDVRGNWSIPEAGVVDIGIGLRVTRYRLSLSSPDLLITAIEGPMFLEAPRPASSIEARIH